jgi:Arc/MetJ-type ribon-helix-helix transcriptional regulator
MNITLPPEQRDWLEARVAEGHFDSIDEALSAAVADLMAVYGDDMTSATPFVDQARASVERGNVLSGEEYFERLDARLESLRRR